MPVLREGVEGPEPRFWVTCGSELLNGLTAMSNSHSLYGYIHLREEIGINMWGGSDFMSWLVLLGCGSSSTHPTQGSPTGACHQCLTFRQIQPVCGHWPQIYVPQCLSAEEKWLFASSFLFPIAMTNPAAAMASVAQGCLGALLQKEEILDIFWEGRKGKAEKLRPHRMGRCLREPVEGPRLQQAKPAVSCCRTLCRECLSLWMH